MEQEEAVNVKLVRKALIVLAGARTTDGNLPGLDEIREELDGLDQTATHTAIGRAAGLVEEAADE